MNVKKYLFIAGFMAVGFQIADSQTALGAFSVSQPDLKGTARYMGMAGAFGALGGDLSAITVNPGGIGVYRSSDIGFTVDLDLQKATTESEGLKYGNNQTKFLLNNIGAVLTLRLPSKTFPNLNFGFAYNKGASFNRMYGGDFNKLRTSMSNYIASTSNYDDITSGDVSSEGGVNPYNVGYEYFQAPWMNILAAQAGILTYEDVPYVDQYGNQSYYTEWYGLWQDSMIGKDTSGRASYLMKEWGGTNDFNIVIGGNIKDVFYWGMNFDIVSVNYQLNTYWGENLKNAYNVDPAGNLISENANWDFNSAYALSGTGFNYQLGFIVKPVQALRLGFAFHTPTWYNLNEEFIGSMNYNGETQAYSATTNYGTPGLNSFNLRTPWKIMASAAGVIGTNLIISFDYEWANYGSMHISEPNYYDDGYGWYDPWDPWMSRSSGTRSNLANWTDPYANENGDISRYYKSSNTFKVGVEFKPVSALSIRAGYAHVSSPVKKSAQDNQELIYAPSLSPSYRFDNNTNYITCGLGYRYSHIYVDLAYVFKRMDSTYHAFAPSLYDPYLDVVRRTQAPQSKISFTNNQIVLSAGYRF